MAIDPGTALGEADQGLVEGIQFLAQLLGRAQGQRSHHAVRLDFQQAADHAALAVGIEAPVDEQEAVGAILGQAEVAPHHRIATTHARAARVFETIVGQAQVLFVTNQHLHCIDHLRRLRRNRFGQHRR